MSPETVVSLVQLAADVTTAALVAGRDAAAPSDFAKRLIGIGIDMVPIDELRAALDERDAGDVDAAVDVAEEAKLAAKKLGG